MFNFEVSQLAHIWDNCSQLQSRQQIEIFAVTYYLWYT